MIKFPQSIIIAMVAFNITAFTVCLQLDLIPFGTITWKIIGWILTIGLWRLAYVRRNKYFTLF